MIAPKSFSDIGGSRNQSQADFGDDLADWGIDRDTFRIDHEEFTWYAFLERSKFHVEESTIYLCPISRMEKWIPLDKRGNPQKWNSSLFLWSV